MPALGQYAGGGQPYGRVSRLSQQSVTHVTSNGSTEGVNKLTYAVERDGLYRVSAVGRLRTAGTGSGQNLKFQVSHNNGTAVSNADIANSGVAGAITALDVTGSAGTYIAQHGLYRAVAGTNIVVSSLGAGTFTTAAVVDLEMSIEAV